jgi:hypothetical protein
MLGEASGETFGLTAAGLSAGFDRDGRGGLISFRTSAGVELAAAPAQAPRLFALTVSRQAQVPGEETALSNADARSFDAALREEADGGICAILTYGGFEKGIERVVCTVRARPGESALRWGIAVAVADGWVLEKVQYPCLTLAAPLGTSVADDAAVVGSAKGGVYRKPGELKGGTWIGHGQPGNLAAQFGCYYDDRAGFYTAAEDAKGYPKDLVILRTGAGVEFSWIRPCFAAGTDTQAYDIVTAGFGGTDGAPADWRDAADLYKAWALRQPWCAVPFAQRADLPAWLKDGPAMVRFGRDWLADPERIERWLTAYWKKQFPAAPLITAYWGWEKRGSWVTPDYFPVYPSDEAFTNLVAKTRELGCHAFPWPSGYHWTLTYNKRPDGSFEWDDRARFDAVARPHAVHKRDGSLYVRVPSWLNGGDTACLCGGAPWTIDWWNEEICVPLARRGCELVQIDQVVGANWPACYADGHGHAKGRGPWMTEAFTRQLTTMREAMRRIEPDAVVCFEEPNEWFNHIVGLQDYRDCEAPREWASVFNYLYHEFLPPFQSNPRGNDRVMAAHCAADGQMPHLVPGGRDLGGEALVNGGFEPRAAGGNPLRGWEQVRGYQGRAWTGQAFGDPAEKRGGTASLRLLNAGTGDVVQVSQNVPVDETGLAAGGRYRLSAWLKTGRMARPNSVNFAVFAPGLKGTGQGGQLKFPAAGSGWARVSGEFAVPEGAEMLRVMIHVDGEAEAWVDDVALEAVAADGSARPVRHDGLSADARFMRNWVALYHGEGRPWLMHGRLLHPPRLACASVPYAAPGGRGPPVAPAVFHNAFRAPDGREAVVLANATRERQEATLFWRGGARKVVLEADGISLIRGGQTAGVKVN